MISFSQSLPIAPAGRGYLGTAPGKTPQVLSRRSNRSRQTENPGREVQGLDENVLRVGLQGLLQGAVDVEEVHHLSLFLGRTPPKKKKLSLFVGGTTPPKTKEKEGGFSGGACRAQRNKFPSQQLTWNDIRGSL